MIKLKIGLGDGSDYDNVYYSEILKPLCNEEYYKDLYSTIAWEFDGIISYYRETELLDETSLDDMFKKLHFNIESYLTRLMEDLEGKIPKSEYKQASDYYDYYCYHSDDFKEQLIELFLIDDRKALQG